MTNACFSFTCILEMPIEISFFTRPAMNASGMGVDLTSSCLADNVGGSDGILGAGISGTCQSS